MSIMNINEYKSSRKWKSVLAELGYPHLGSWDDKTFTMAIYRASKERKELLHWLAPKILKCCGRSKKFPGEIALPDVYSQFVFIKREEIEGFIEGSLAKPKQEEIWCSVFCKIDLLWERTSDANPGISPEEQALVIGGEQVLRKAEELLSKPLPQVVNINSPAGNHEVFSQVDGWLDGIEKYYDEAKKLNMNPAYSNLDVNLTPLKTMSEMVAAMKRSV